MTLPTPRIHERPRSTAVLEAALAAGYTPLQARLLAARLPDAYAADVTGLVAPAMTALDGPALLPDIHAATERVARAVLTEEPILLLSDHDVDGCTANAVMREVFLDIFHHPPERLHSYMGHRLQEGYGVSAGLAARILADGHRDGLCITADCGSADEPRIAQLRAAGLETVVTDHHEIDDPPPSAIATVNPTRHDSVFPDKFIAGCHVAWLLMCAVRTRLIECGHLPANTPTLARCIDLLGAGVVADCVSLGLSRNNRLLVQRGLAMMNQPNARPCWQALRPVLGKEHQPFTAQDLGFSIGPMLNARGRLDENITGVRFLRAPTTEAAAELAEELRSCNEQRKGIERDMKDRAMVQAAQLVAGGAHGVALWCPDGSPAVHGIVASRIVEAFGRPTVCLSPSATDPDLITGSARTVPAVHVRQTLQAVDRAHPGLLIGFGGHAGAGGLRLARRDIERFQFAWDDAVRALGLTLAPEVLTDGPLGQAPSLQLLSELAVLGPYGRGFEAPAFHEQAQILTVKVMGEQGTHLRLGLTIAGGHAAEAVWFHARPPGAPMPVEPGDRVDLVFEVDANHYRGNTRVQLKVRTAQRLA